MTRFFYTDPLAAAWMAKHFGMRFVSWDSGKEYESSVIVCNAGSPIRSIREDQRYVVHPESLHLLEPRLGDLTEDAEWIVDAVDGLSTHREVERSTVRHWFETGQSYQIIQRDGKPFFWPQAA